MDLIELVILREIINSLNGKTNTQSVSRDSGCDVSICVEYAHKLCMPLRSVSNYLKIELNCDYNCVESRKFCNGISDSSIGYSTQFQDMVHEKCLAEGIDLNDSLAESDDAGPYR